MNQGWFRLKLFHNALQQKISMHLASSTLSDTVSAAATAQRRAVLLSAPASSFSALPPLQLLRRVLHVDDSSEAPPSCSTAMHFECR